MGGIRDMTFTHIVYIILYMVHQTLRLCKSRCAVGGRTRTLQGWVARCSLTSSMKSEKRSWNTAQAHGSSK